MSVSLPHVIGIGGLARAGKDTFAKVVADLTPASTRVAFADAVRKAAAAAYGVDVGEFTDDRLKDAVYPTWGITRRKMLNVVGEMMRRADPDHWVRRLWQQLDDLGNGAIERIVTDVRRLNEAAMIHDLGGVNILVRRPGVEWNGQPMEALAEVAGRAFDDGRPVVYGDERLLDAAADEVLGKWQHHAGRVVFDHVVDNDGDVAKLKKVAQMFIGSRLTNPEEAT